MKGVFPSKCETVRKCMVSFVGEGSFDLHVAMVRNCGLSAHFEAFEINYPKMVFLENFRRSRGRLSGHCQKDVFRDFQRTPHRLSKRHLREGQIGQNIVKVVSKIIFRALSAMF